MNKKNRSDAILSVVLLSVAGLTACVVVVLLILGKYYAALFVAPVTITVLTLFFADMALKRFAEKTIEKQGANQMANDKGQMTSESRGEGQISNNYELVIIDEENQTINNDEISQ